jgi:hypothetical protein
MYAIETQTPVTYHYEHPRPSVTVDMVVLNAASRKLWLLHATMAWSLMSMDTER